MFHKGKAGTLSAKQTELLNDAHACAEHMADTVGAMLMLSRLEAGKVHLDIAPVDVLALLQDIWKDFSVTVEKKEQNYQFDCDAKLTIQTDKKLLKEVLSNLMSNAVKYTPERGAITITAAETEMGYRLTVKDSGLGIPRHQQEEVFSKFFRADNVIAKQTEGTGLGLYLVHSLVTLLGGNIAFTSEEGNGATFYIDLPTLPPNHAQ